MAHERENSESKHDDTATSSLRRGQPLIISEVLSSRSDDDIESECVSQDGDIGDRALNSSRYDENNNSNISFVSLASLSQGEHTDPHTKEIRVIESKKIHTSLHYISCILHLSVFGILGILSRYLLDKLFGPEIVGLTSNDSILYPDLPSNMVGSFLMGWFGSVFKEDIVKVSDTLAIGLTTGYLGSLTTFSGWNQKMVELGCTGHWFFAVLGFLLGLFLVAYSIIFGAETAEGMKWVLRRVKNVGPTCDGFRGAVDRNLGLVTGSVMLVLLGCLWGLSAALEEREFRKRGGTGRRLWLACLVGPTGVWIRWLSARLNGRGLGGSGALRWVPFGTLIVNVSAAGLMAALATLKKSVAEGDRVEVVASGIQLGFLGCLSTVSTFVAEFEAMRGSKYPWRAYVYAAFTISPSFGLGVLIYCIPVWVKGYN